MEKGLIFRRFVKFLEATISVITIALLHRTTRLEGFSLNLFLDYFSKVCRENSSYIERYQE
jgi:hypothetical protein